MIRRILLSLVCLVAVLVIIAALIGWRNSIRLENNIKQIKAAGDPVTIPDLEQKDIAPTENAAIYLGRIAADTKKLYSEIQPAVHIEGVTWKTGLTELQREQVRLGFESYPQVLEMLEKGSRCTDHASPLEFNLPPTQFIEANIQQVQHARECARILDCYSRYLVSCGEGDKAVEAGLRLLRLSRLQSQEPLLIGNLVHSATEGIGIGALNGILRTSKLSPESYVAIESELAKHDPFESLVHALKTERAFSIDSMRSQFGGFFMSWFGGSFLDSMDNWISNAKRPIGELKSLEVSTEPFTALVGPALNQAREATNRVAANIRCLRILNAILAKEATGNAVDINSLGLPQNVMIDPYNSKPLIILQTPEGWMIYSVGRNGLDDGGSLHNQADTGLGPLERMEN